MSRTMRKKIFTHYDLFEAVSQGNISRDQTITLFDKEWLFDNWKKRRYKAYDLYSLATLLDAIIYKNTLQEKDTSYLEQLSSSFLIFIGFFSEESDTIHKDIQHNAHKADENRHTVNIPVDSYFTSTYFFKSRHIREQMHDRLNACIGSCDPHDI